MKNKTKRSIVYTLLFVILAFLIVSYIVQKNLPFLTQVIQQNYALGLVIFTLLNILSVVIAPIATIPLIPVASNTYGVLITAISFSIGEIVGSIIAFWIGRRYGKDLVKKIVSIEQAEEVSGALSKKNLFFSLILLRVVVPTDILSYALGIFTNIKFRMYFITLAIGVIPGAFYFSYLGSLPLASQVIGWIAGIIILFILVWWMFKEEKKK